MRDNPGMLLALILFIGSVIFLIFNLSRPKPNTGLVDKFAWLGVLKGRTREEIERVAGPPTAISFLSDRHMYQWIDDNYQIVLIFRNGTCDGVGFEQLGP